MPGIMPITFCSGPSFVDLRELLAEVVERELALAEPLFLPQHFVLVEFLLGLFDEREEVALAEDAAGHAVGVELFERVEVFAGADELDRDAGDLLDARGPRRRGRRRRASS